VTTRRVRTKPYPRTRNATLTEIEENAAHAKRIAAEQAEADVWYAAEVAKMKERSPA
jgi:hypothetical protein